MMYPPIKRHKYCSICGKGYTYCKDCGDEIHFCSEDKSFILPSSLHTCHPKYNFIISSLPVEKYCSICGREYPDPYFCAKCGEKIYPKHHCNKGNDSIIPLIDFSKNNDGHTCS